MREHVILNHQNKPAKLLLWETSSVITVVLSFLLGTILFSIFMGVIEAVSSAFAIRWYKKRFGKGSFIGLRYWVLPHDKKRHPLTPPSYIREFRG